MTTDFKLSLQIKQKSSGSAVSFKQDGQRFEQTHTVKLNADTDYEIRFIVRPCVYLE